MSTSDPTGSDPVAEAPAAGPAHMDVQTTQQMIREMTTLTSAMFSLLQPHPAPEPGASPEAAPSSPAVPLPDLPDLPANPEAPVAPQPPATAPLASIPLPSLPVPDLPPEPEVVDDEDQPAKDGRLSMALMNEIAFLDG